jgi:hypothetical protein
MGAFKWAKTWGRDELTASQKFVLVMIADHFNDAQKRAWPSISTLARETCMSVSTVTRCLRHLERLQLIQTETWVKSGTEMRMHNRYCLPLYDPKSLAQSKVEGFVGFDVDGTWLVESLPMDNAPVPVDNSPVRTRF